MSSFTALFLVAFLFFVTSNGVIQHEHVLIEVGRPFEYAIHNNNEQFIRMLPGSDWVFSSPALYGTTSTSNSLSGHFYHTIANVFIGVYHSGASGGGGDFHVVNLTAELSPQGELDWRKIHTPLPYSDKGKSITWDVSKPDIVFVGYDKNGIAGYNLWDHSFLGGFRHNSTIDQLPTHKYISLAIAPWNPDLLLGYLLNYPPIIDIIDISTPPDYSLLGSHSLSYNAPDVAELIVHKDFPNLAFATTWDTIEVIDLVNPAGPTEYVKWTSFERLGSMTVANTSSYGLIAIVAEGGYTCDTSCKLYIFDINGANILNTPTPPCIANYSGIIAEGISVNEEMELVVITEDASNGVILFDISSTTIERYGLYPSSRWANVDLNRMAKNPAYIFNNPPRIISYGQASVNCFDFIDISLHGTPITNNLGHNVVGYSIGKGEENEEEHTFDVLVTYFPTLDKNFFDKSIAVNNTLSIDFNLGNTFSDMDPHWLYLDLARPSPVNEWLHLYSDFTLKTFYQSPYMSIIDQAYEFDSIVVATPPDPLLASFAVFYISQTHWYSMSFNLQTTPELINAKEQILGFNGFYHPIYVFKNYQQSAYFIIGSNGYRSIFMEIDPYLGTFIGSQYAIDWTNTPIGDGCKNCNNREHTLGPIQIPGTDLFYFAYNKPQRVLLYDFSTISTPTLQNYWQLTGMDANCYISAFVVDFDTNIAYFGFSNLGSTRFAVMNMSVADPITSLVLFTRLCGDCPSSHKTVSQIIDTDRKLLYELGRDWLINYISVYDVTDPWNPTLVKYMGALTPYSYGQYLQMRLATTMLYVSLSGTTNGLFAIDMSDPTHPFVSGQDQRFLNVKDFDMVPFGEYNRFILAAGYSVHFVSAQNFRLEGIPHQISQAGTFSVSVGVRDNYGASVSTDFDIRVEHYPEVTNLILNQSALIGIPWTFFVDQDTFYDANNDILSFTAKQVIGGLPVALPSWLSFNPVSAIFAGTPLTSGLLELQVIADDHTGGTCLTSFFLLIHNAPGVAMSIPDQAAAIDFIYSYVIDVDSAFYDADGHTLSLSATRIDKTPLPGWLSFTTSNFTFRGIPSESDSSLSIMVIADDGYGGTVSDVFVLTVEHFPTVLNTIDDQSIIIGAFSFDIPNNVFFDSDQDPLTLGAALDVGPLPSWLQFYPSTGTFSGTATAPGSWIVLVTANDGRGGSISTSFNLTVRAFVLPAIAPTSVSISSPTYHSLLVSWNAGDPRECAGFFSHWSVEYPIASHLKFSPAGCLSSDLTNRSTLSCNATGLQSATTYSFTITEICTNALVSSPESLSSPLFATNTIAATSPLTVSVSNPQRHSIDIEWTAGTPNDCVFARWEIRFSPENTTPKGCGYEDLLGGRAYHACTATGLNANTNYSFTVAEACLNPLAKSPASTPSTLIYSLKCQERCSVCDTVSDGCWICINATDRFSALPGLQSTSCLSTCPPLQYASPGSVCQTCPGRCLECDNTIGACTKCNSFGYWLSDDPGYSGTSCVASCPGSKVKSALVGETAQCIFQCPAGSWATFNEPCQSCHSSCATCNPTTGGCLTCTNPTHVFRGFKSEANTVCNETCLDNSYASPGSVCQTCPGNCLECDNTIGACTKCNSVGYWLSDDPGYSGTSCVASCPGSKVKSALVGETAQCIFQCPAGNFASPNEPCALCDDSCATCSSATGGCLTCSNVTYVFDGYKGAEDTTCIETCPSKYYAIAGEECMSCSTCLECNNINGACTKCNNVGYWLSDDPGYSGTSCISSCPGSKVKSALVGETAQCIFQCPAGSFASPNEPCALCDDSCATCSSTTGGCLTCSNVTYVFDGFKGAEDTICSETCPSKYYAVAGEECISCHSKCKTCDPVTGSCTSCYSGEYLYLDTVTELTSCLADCPQSYVKDILSVNNSLANCISMCPIGLFAAPNKICTSCITNDTKCETCDYTTGGCMTCEEEGYWLSGFAGETGTMCITDCGSMVKNKKTGEDAQCLLKCPVGYYASSNEVCPEVSDAQVTLYYIAGGILLLVLIVIVVSCIGRMRKVSGEQQPMTIVTLAIAIYDFSTDLLLLFSIRAIPEVYLHFLIGCGFLVFSILSNTIVLILMLSQQVKIPIFRRWLKNRPGLFGLMVVVCTTNLNVASLFTSKLCGLQIFSAPFTADQEIRLKGLGLLSHVFEDIPQLVVQLSIASTLYGLSLDTLYQYPPELVMSIAATILSLASGLFSRLLLLCAFYAAKDVQKSFQPPSVYNGDQQIVMGGRTAGEGPITPGEQHPANNMIEMPIQSIPGMEAFSSDLISGNEGKQVEMNAQSQQSQSMKVQSFQQQMQRPQAQSMAVTQFPSQNNQRPMSQSFAQPQQHSQRPMVQMQQMATPTPPPSQ